MGAKRAARTRRHDGVPHGRFGPAGLAAAMRQLGERNWYLPPWLAWLPDLQVEGARPAPLQPAVLVRQYTGDGVLSEPSLDPPDPAATSKES